MSAELLDLQRKIRALAAGERIELLREMIADLEGPADEDVEALWLREAQRRHKELLEGRIKTIPAEEVFEKIREQFPK